MEHKMHKEAARFIAGAAFQQVGKLWQRPGRAPMLWGVSFGFLVFTATIRFGDLSHVQKQIRQAQQMLQTEKLHRAVAQSNVPGVYEALQAGANPNGLQQENALPPVCRAVWQDDVQTLNLLLTHGANATVSCGDRNADGTPDTALYLAALSHNPDLVKNLIGYGASPNDDTERPGESRALRTAAWRGHLAAVDTLLEAGANPYTLHTTGTGKRAKTGSLVAALKAAGWKDCAERIQQAQLTQHAPREVREPALPPFHRSIK